MTHRLREYRRCALIATAEAGNPFIRAWCRAALVANPEIPEYMDKKELHMCTSHYDELIDMTLAHGVSHLKDPEEILAVAKRLSDELDGHT